MTDFLRSPWLAGGVLALAVGAFVALAVGGWRVHAVLTSSMAPTIPAGSLAILEPVEPEALGPGEVIVFRHPYDPDGALIAHRVTVVVRSNEAVGFATRGDANARSDSWVVSAGDVEGRLRAHLPGVGAAVDRAGQSPLLLAAAGLLMLAALLSDSRTLGAWLRQVRTTSRDELHERLQALAVDSSAPGRSR